MSKPYRIVSREDYINIRTHTRYGEDVDVTCLPYPITLEEIEQLKNGYLLLVDNAIGLDTWGFGIAKSDDRFSREATEVAKEDE